MAPYTLRRAVIFGGRKSPEEPSSQLFLVDMDSNVAHEVKDVGGAIPQKRWKHTLTQTDEGKYLLIGGKDNVRIFDDVYELDLEKNCWRIVGKLSEALHSHSAVRIHDKVFTSGGLNSEGKIHSALFVIDTAGIPSVLQPLEITGMIPRYTTSLLKKEISKLTNIFYSTKVFPL